VAVRRTGVFPGEETGLPRPKLFWMQPLELVELAAVVLGLTCVWLTVRQNIWCWPAGLGQVFLYIAIFYQVRLYSDMGLHAIYVLLGLYGWWHWLRGGPAGGTLPVTRIKPGPAARWFAVALLGTGALGGAMATYTDAALPYWDAGTTVLSLIAQWLLARKVLESWLVWIAVDILSLGIYYSRALYLTMGLYGVFLILAIIGYREWRRSHAAARTA
jgi:nicotinamide mononucleotide transporter